jgi:surface antigen
VLEANVTPIYGTGGEEGYSTANPDLPPQVASKQKGQPEPTAANGRHKRNCNSGEGLDTKPGCSERPPNAGIVKACIVKQQQLKVGSKVVGESVKQQQQQQQPECPKNASVAALEKQPNKQDVSSVWTKANNNFCIHVVWVVQYFTHHFHSSYFFLQLEFLILNLNTSVLFHYI